MRSAAAASTRRASFFAQAWRHGPACGLAAMLGFSPPCAAAGLNAALPADIPQIPLSALGDIQLTYPPLEAGSPCRASDAPVQAVKAAADRAARPKSNKPSFDVATTTARAMAGDVAAMKAMGRYSVAGGEHIGGYWAGRDWGEAARWYGLAAAKGDPVAMVSLSTLFSEGEETQLPRNRRLADLWYDKALADARRRAASGDPQSMVWLGDLLQRSSVRGSGFYSKAGMAKAMPWYRRAATAGNAAGLERLASAYFRGEVVPRDTARGRLLLIRAVAGGDLLAMLGLAEEYVKDKDIVSAMALWKQAAQLGDDGARDELSRHYAAGDSVELNDEEALKWAMMGGDDRADAAYHIAFLREPIPSGSADTHWLCIAALAGQPSAMDSLGANLSGPESRAWIRAAAEAGDPMGRQNYANSRLQGDEAAQAAQWEAEGEAQERAALLAEAARLQLMIDAGNVRATMQLARLYLDNDHLVDPDGHRSLDTFLRAAQSGDTEGMVMYGFLLQRTDRDAGNAWVLRAARLGYPRAMEIIGQALVDGRDIAQDKAAGIAWLRKAVAADNDSAYQDLARRYASGDGVPQDLAMADRLRREVR
ncbi:MAG: hypothetical protein JWM33_3238 [Caulobacteraceae bacterium]|nr:hypothetical protein [Caulobacteraceae bacterium]